MAIKVPIWIICFYTYYELKIFVTFTFIVYNEFCTYLIHCEFLNESASELGIKRMLGCMTMEYNNKHIIHLMFLLVYTGWSKKKFMMWSGGKVFEKFGNIFYGVFLSIYSHLLKKFELSKLCGKKVMGL